MSIWLDWQTTWQSFPSTPTYSLTSFFSINNALTSAEKPHDNESGCVFRSFTSSYTHISHAFCNYFAKKKQKNYSDIISLAFKIMTSRKSLRVHLAGVRVAEKLIACRLREAQRSLSSRRIDAFSSSALHLRKLVLEDRAARMADAILCLGVMSFTNDLFHRLFGDKYFERLPRAISLFFSRCYFRQQLRLCLDCCSIDLKMKPASVWPSLCFRARPRATTLLNLNSRALDGLQGNALGRQRQH